MSSLMSFQIGRRHRDGADEFAKILLV